MEVPRPFSCGRDWWQTFLQNVCPGGGLPAPEAELQKAVRRLCGIREAEEELDSWLQIQSSVGPQPTAKNSTNTHRRERCQYCKRMEACNSKEHQGEQSFPKV